MCEGTRVCERVKLCEGGKEYNGCEAKKNSVEVNKCERKECVKGIKSV